MMQERDNGLAALGRHAVWLLALCVVLGALVQVRIEVQDLRERLARSRSGLQAAETLRDRLSVELGARRRAVAMEAAAKRLNLGTPAQIVQLPMPAATVAGPTVTDPNTVAAPTVPGNGRVAEVRR